MSKRDSEFESVGDLDQQAQGLGASTDSTLLRRIEDCSNQIDQSSSVLFSFVRELKANASYWNTQNQFTLFPDQLEELFSRSTALAFTIWQHLAAVERLESHSDWKTDHQKTWQKLSSGLELCGLATTHIANPSGSGVRGVDHPEYYLVSGLAPWVCGFELYEKLVVGFETASESVFALVAFPSDSEVDIKKHELAVLNGTSTVSINFNEFKIHKADCVSIRRKDGVPVSPRKSSYLLPEIGIAKGVIEKIRSTVANSNHPKHQLIRENLGQLNRRLESFKQKRETGLPLSELIVERDKIIRDSIRLLGITIGASSLSKGSLVSRLQLEATFLDQLILSPETLRLRVAQICSEQ